MLRHRPSIVTATVAAVLLAPAASLAEDHLDEGASADTTHDDTTDEQPTDAGDERSDDAGGERSDDAGDGQPADGVPDEELAGVLEELSEAEEGLAGARARLEAAEAELDAIDRRIGVAVGELLRIEERLEEAEDAYRRARADTEEAEAAVGEAGSRLDLAADLEAEAVERLERRAAEVYKRTTTVPQHVLLRGVAGAGDWHQVAVTLRTFDRVLVHDRHVLDDAITARALADSARDHAARMQQRAAEAEARAEAELARLEALRADQAVVVEAAQRERRRQSGIYAALEQDAAVMEALKLKLEEEIAALRGEAPPETRAVTGRGTPSWAGRLPPVGRSWAEPIDAAGRARGVDGRLLAALVWTESTFNPRAVSSAGAIGLTQLMPRTAASLGVDPWVPEQNLDGGARYLRAQLDRFGSVELALAAYNAGPGAVSRHGGIPPFAQTQLYVVRVLERYRRLLG